MPIRVLWQVIMEESVDSRGVHNAGEDSDSGSEPEPL
jgi:hypothetical protein